MSAPAGRLYYALRRGVSRASDAAPCRLLVGYVRDMAARKRGLRRERLLTPNGATQSAAKCLYALRGFRRALA
jgi:hypothetical protein